jgi:hypothetical protein
MKGIMNQNNQTLKRIIQQDINKRQNSLNQENKLIFKFNDDESETSDQKNIILTTDHNFNIDKKKMQNEFQRISKVNITRFARL